jgi:hypothetical protein
MLCLFPLTTVSRMLLYTGLSKRKAQTNMAGEVVLYDSIRQSNIPREEKSQLRQWFEGTVGNALTQVRPRGQVRSGLSAFRQSSESLLTGAVLGALNVELKNGLDVHGVPVDGVAGVILTAASAVAGDSEFGPDARNIGTQCLGIWSFRQTTDLLAEKRLAKGKTLPPHLTHSGAKVAGESNVAGDPIVQASKVL